MTPRRIALALIAGILFVLLILLVLPNHQRFVVDDMSKPQTFTYRRYKFFPTGIRLDVKGEVRDGAANVVLRPCDQQSYFYRDQYVGKVDAHLGGDYFENKACIDYIPVRSPKGRLEFTIR